MLSDFFRINLPYGITRNEKGEWMAFNREYMPLGFNDTSKKSNYFSEINNFFELPVYTKYKNLTEKTLLKLAARSGEAVKRNEDGKIITVWLYNDSTNPVNSSKDNKKFWEIYFEKLKILSKLKIT